MSTKTALELLLPAMEQIDVKQGRMTALNTSHFAKSKRSRWLQDSLQALFRKGGYRSLHRINAVCGVLTTSDKHFSNPFNLTYKINSQKYKVLNNCFSSPDMQCP